MKIYLVTGGAGFIGANFVKYMLRQYREIKLLILDKLTYAGNLSTIASEIQDSRVVFIKGDIKNKDLVEHVFSQYNIDYVVNFAAESHVDRSIEHPQIFLETNILGTQNLLECSKAAWMTGSDNNGYPIYKSGVKYLQVSTDEVYGSLPKDFSEATEMAMDDVIMQHVVKNRKLMTYGEQFFTEETNLDPRSPYSASKASADLVVKAYADTYKLPVNITRCSNNYGPYHFPEKLIPLIILNVLEGKQLPVYGDGKNVRDWLYVEDHAKAIEKVIHNGVIGEIYNVGGFNEEENINIVKLIIDLIKSIMMEEPHYQKLLKTELGNVNYSLIAFVKDRLGHDVRYAIDPTKITRDLGWYPETSFRVGIEQTIRWYLDNQEWVEEIVSGEYREYYTQKYQ